MVRRCDAMKWGILGFCALFGIFCGCEREMSGHEPPLRPLIYTELPPNEVEVEKVAPPEVINVAPEDLGYTLFHALIDHDRKAYESMFISGSELSSLIRMSEDKATEQAANIVKKSESLWTLFSPVIAAEEPIGGLSTRLRLVEFKLGKGRNLAGKIASPDHDELIQHWGNELRIELVDTPKFFTIRVPKIVKTEHGWRIAQPVEIDKTLAIFLQAGMHLKMDLLTSEHYPMPLEVGNFWKYRVEKTLEDNVTVIPEDHETTVTDMITEIVKREGFWIVSFERTQSAAEDQDPEVTHSSWIATPRMILPCLRDCRANVDNISYILGYIMRQTPFFVFPLESVRSWNTAGQRTGYARYEVRMRHSEPITVPGGSFSGVYEIYGSINEGQENRYFMPGTGVIMRTVRTGTGTRREMLIKYRLIF